MLLLECPYRATYPLPNMYIKQSMYHGLIEYGILLCGRQKLLHSSIIVLTVKNSRINELVDFSIGPLRHPPHTLTDACMALKGMGFWW